MPKKRPSEFMIALNELKDVIPDDHFRLVGRLKHARDTELAEQREDRDLAHTTARFYRGERNLLAQLIDYGWPSREDPDLPRTELADRALRALGRVHRVERGCVVLFDPDTGEPEIIRTLGDLHTREVRNSLSTGILARVWTRNEQEYAFDANVQPEYQEFESVGRLGLRTVLCCPVPGQDPDHPRGALYVENRNLQDAFSETTYAAVDFLARLLANDLDALAGREQRDDPTLPFRKHGRFHRIIGSSQALANIFRISERIAARDPLPNLLLTGETGVGKTLLARTLHEISPRSAGPFIPASAAALPDTLFENEMFGSDRGAFTGAVGHPGLLRRAHGGTLLIDEIDTATDRVQVKLLQMLEDPRVRALGSESEDTVDVWLVAATNADLAELVREGRFRRDLYQRLIQQQLTIPPLRSRPADIGPLARHFAAEAAPNGAPALAPDLMFYLRTRHWSGNVRELRNTMQSLASMVDHAVLTLDDLRAVHNEIPADDSVSLDWNENKDRVFRELLVLARDRCLGDTNEMARVLGLSRSRVYHWLKVYRLGSGTIPPSRTRSTASKSRRR